MPNPLNPEQLAAVNSRKGRILVNAAAGSGKTRVIVQRVLDITNEGVAARRILSTTFTKEAAMEMNNRAARYLLAVESNAKVAQARLDAIVKERGLAATNGHHVFCTFHSLAYRFIRHNHHEHFPHLSPGIIATGFELAKALRLGLKEAGLDAKQKKALISYISSCKRKRIDAAHAVELEQNRIEESGPGAEWAEQFAQAYGYYQRALHAAGALDFDDLLVEMAGLLESNADIRARWQFEYVQVDEAQDTDVLQWAIVDMLSQKYGNLFCVGDENQGMYSFRGAESNLQANFESRYPGARVFILPENYRSTDSIVQLCREIAPLQNDTIKNLRTSNPAGKPPVFVQYGTEEDETMWVMKKVTDVSHSAILARTNAQLQPYEDACTDAGIPFHILGKGGFWRQHEVETCMALVRCWLAPTERSIHKAIRSPYSFVRAGAPEKDRCLEWLSEKAKKIKDGRSLLETLRQYPLPPFNALPYFFMRDRGQGTKGMQSLFEGAGVLSYYREKDGDEDIPDNNRLENVSRIIDVASKFPTIGKFLEFAERVRKENKSTKAALTLSTIHKSKGLEWLDVFVIGVNNGKFPSTYAVSEDDMQEEQRVFFVACSRAARFLHVSCNDEPSPFIAERVEDRTARTVPLSKEDQWVANWSLEAEGPNG